MRIINLLRQNWLVSLITLFCCSVSFYHGCSYISNPSSYTLYSLSVENNNIYLANFLKREAAIEVKIEKNIFINKPGQLTVVRNNQSVNEVSQTNINNRLIKKFDLQPNDRVCIDLFCKISSKEIALLSVYDAQNNSTIATSSFAYLGRGAFPVNDTMGIMSDITSSYILLNNDTNHIQYIDSLSNNKPYYINYKKSGYSVKKIVWLTLSTLLLGSFILFVLLNYKKIYTALIKNNLIFAIPFTVYTVFIYLTVFPAIFAGDIVLMYISMDTFYEWYTATYMAYSYLVYFLGQQFIILPTLVLFWASTLYLVNSSRYISKNIYIFTSCYTILLLLFIPYIFITVYGVQRYFTAATVFISGLQFIFSAYLRSSKGNSENYKKTINFGIALIIFACALRVEYCIVSIIFIYAIEKYFNFSTKKKSILNSLYVCATALLIEFILSGNLSVIYDYDRSAYKIDYRLITLVNLTGAYVECPAPEKNYVDQHLAPQMSQAEICNLNYSLEKYFWQKVSPLDTKQKQELHDKIISTLPAKLIEDPKKMVRYLLTKGYYLMYLDIWSIANKYKISDYDVHFTHADRFHMFDYDLLGKRVYNSVIDYYYLLGKYNYIYQVASLILIFLINPIFFHRHSVCLLTNLSIALLFCFIILSSPSLGQWGYLVFIPIWCCYAPIFILFEQQIRKSTDIKNTVT